MTMPVAGQKTEDRSVKARARIGLEIHVYLLTREKLFCRCKAEHGKKLTEPNTNICPICTGQPGAKPMLPNKEAIDKALKIALMLNCKINTGKDGKVVVWQRKHYDWPDLPKGYQDTQSGAYSVPLAINGKFEGIRIKELHVEEDPASWNPETGAIDYNRSGIPLVEIVTEPDFSSGEQVVEWLKKLMLVLAYVKAIDKTAGLKADVNISLVGANDDARVEVLNSLEAIEKAIAYEIRRQEQEGTSRETRRYDSAKGKTVKMREKETQADYRFIPDPDLPMLKISQARVEKLKKELPEAPQKKLEKLLSEHGIDKKAADVLANDVDLVMLFERVVGLGIKPATAVKWLTIELLRVLNYNKLTLDECEIKPEHVAELIRLVEEGKITELKAKQILNEFVPRSFSPRQKLKEAKKITSVAVLEGIIDNVLASNEKAVQDYMSGKEEAFNFLLGQIMKASERRADYRLASKLLRKKLDARSA